MMSVKSRAGPLMRVLTSGRFWLAGPVAFLLAIVVMLGMAVWFPKGQAQVDNIVLPMIVFPLIWATLFFYAYLEHKPKRTAWLFSALAAVHMAILVSHFVKA